MAYKITVDHPSIGDESDLFIHGLGTFRNKTSTVVPNSAIGNYRRANSTIESTTDEEGRVTHKGVKGVHPVEQTIFGVTIEKVDDSELNKDEPKPEGDEAK